MCGLISLNRLEVFPLYHWVQRALSGATCPQCRHAGGGLRSRRRLTETQHRLTAQWGQDYFGQYAGYANQYLLHWVDPNKVRVCP